MLRYDLRPGDEGVTIGGTTPKTLALVALLASAAITGASAAAHPIRAAACSPSKTIPLGNRRTAYAAVVERPLVAFRRPGSGPVADFTRWNANGAPTVLSVLGERVGRRCHATWYHVELPVRPNMLTAWVPAGRVGIAVVHTRIVIDVSARTVTLYRRGRPVLRTPAAVGKPGTPTPLGRYYVKERLIPSDPGGAYGPRALGISAFSPVLSNWAQGGPIGIHGTNEPSSIGRAVSHGCVRVPNSVIVRLFHASLPGTPVLIHR